MSIKTCRYCGREFEGAKRGVCCGRPECVVAHKNYCAERNRERSRAKGRARPKRYKATCPVCGNHFVTGHRGKIYCSETCQSKAEYMRKNNIPFPFKRSYETMKVGDTQASLESRIESGWYDGKREEDYINKHCRIDLTPYEDLMKARKNG